MSYLHPDYDEWYNVKGGPSVFACTGWWKVGPYWGQEYEDGWFSVDSDEWWGEFPFKAEAEAHLGVAFLPDPEYDEVYGDDS